MLRSIAISNYKCFRQVENLSLGAHWTVVVGQNNSGKSALLKSFDFTRAASTPYRGAATEVDIPTDANSNVSFSVEIGGPDLRRFMLQSRSALHWQRSSHDGNIRNLTPEQIELEFQNTIGSGKLLINGELFFQQQPTNIQISNEVGSVLFPGNIFSVISPNPDNNTFGYSHGNSGANDSYYAAFVLGAHSSSTYLFGAERLYIGSSTIADNLFLEANAANLAQVVHRLRQLPVLFRQYVDLVREVIPSITDVVPSVTNASQVEIKISSHDPLSDREDLNFSLQDCGTGVAQICAMLFVVVTSKYPKTIIIDEPNSFLHPGASKKLIQILKRFPQHQFIISTHSPELLDAADPEVLLHVEWKPSGSEVKQIDRSDLNQTRNALADLGVSLADVFSADNVIWVEGPTEERCFKEILRAEDRLIPSGLSILPVRSTDELKGKNKKAFFEIYQSISQKTSLLPVKCRFAFDSEGLTERDKEDLNRASHGMFNFLPRRMFENFLIHPVAISHILGLENDHAVMNFLSENGGQKRYHLDTNWKGDIYDREWLLSVDGAKLLQDLFSEVSGVTVEYLKVTHGFEIVSYLLENEPAFLTELKQHVLELIS